jgi:hypothetical protein
LQRSPADRRHELKLPTSLRNFLWVFFALLLLCGIAETLCRTVLHLRFYPYMNPFLIQYYPDFKVFYPRFALLHTAAFFNPGLGAPFMYPAPVALIYGLFYLAPTPLRLTLFQIFVAAVFLITAILFARTLHRKGLKPLTAYAFPLSVLAFAFPVWFEYRQANMEIVLYLLTTLGVVLFLTRRGYSAAACFGIAASMKLYPIAYLGLFLIRRQYRQIAAGIAAAIATTLAGLWFVGPTLSAAWRGTNDGLASFRARYMLTKRPEIGFDHSLLTVIKVPIHNFPPPAHFAPVLTAYLAIVALTGIALFFLRIWKLPVTNQVLFLAVACIWFPPVSFEYTLLHLLAPLGMLVILALDAARLRLSIPGLRAALLCLAVLMAPLSEFIIRRRTFDGQLKAVTLGLLFLIAITWPLELPSTQEAPSPQPQDLAHPEISPIPHERPLLH